MRLTLILMKIKNNYPSQIFGRRILSGFIIMTLIIGCTTIAGSGAGDNIQPPSSAAKRVSSQIIIKFRVDGFDPSSPAFVEHLSHDVDAQLTYLRPMSGDAHVFSLKNIADIARIKEIVRILKERPDILYIEQDNIMQHQRKKE
jgi:hypothetical protein